jgi:hypothetical protein
MNTITCENAYYIKLGRNGIWEESSLKKNIMRIGWKNQSLSDINNGNWEIIQKQIIAETADKGAATRDCGALRMICESTNDDIWITFHGNYLWWCKVTEAEIYKDEVSKYRKVDKWFCEDICGNKLLTIQIPGRIGKLQGFRGTACKVREIDELVRLLNCQPSTEYEAIRDSKENLYGHVEAGLRRLHWKDFETLVDLLFRATGWRRISPLGETMKYSDIELEDPINEEMYQVQVKSSASLRDFQEYSKRFAAGKYRKLFFVVHTPDAQLARTPQQNGSQVQLVLPRRLAEMVVDLGMLNWLLNKIR